MKWVREIKAVGISDWFWFVVLLRRNEFHPRLDRRKYPMTKYGSAMCIRERQRAHKIDMILSDLT